MTDSAKKLQDLLNNSSLSKLADSFKNSPMQELIEATRKSAMACEIPKEVFSIPRIDPVRIPTSKEQNSYQSAGELMRRLADTVTQWRTQVPADSQPAIIAVLHGGIQINVTLLAEESFHGIRIEGTIDGNPCMLLAHQSTVQLLCHIAKVEKEEFRRKIGFIIDGKETSV